MPNKPKEVFATNVINCNGRDFNNCGAALHYKDALNESIQALITTFRDGSREVCCPHLATNIDDDQSCRAHLRDDSLYPHCPFSFKKNK